MEIQQHVFVLNRLGRIVTHILLPNFLCSTKHQPITPGFEDRTGPKETLLCRVSRVAHGNPSFFFQKTTRCKAGSAVGWGGPQGGSCRTVAQGEEGAGRAAIARSNRKPSIYSLSLALFVLALTTTSSCAAETPFNSRSALGLRSSSPAAAGIQATFYSRSAQPY